MDSKGSRTPLILQGAASLQSLMSDMFLPSKGLFFFPSTAEALNPCIFLTWPFKKLHFSPPRHYVLRNKLPGNFKKGVRLVWRRTFLIRALTEEDSSNDGAFDLAPLDNIPPYERQVRRLPKDKRMFSSTVEKFENIPEFWLTFKESSRVAGSSADISLTFSCWMLLSILE